MTQKTAEISLGIINIFHAIDQGMPVSRIKMFMLVAKAEEASNRGLLVHELCTALEQPQASVWRHVAALSTMDTMTKKAAGVVETVPDKADPRRHRVHLTPKGRELLREIENVLKGK